MSTGNSQKVIFPSGKEEDEKEAWDLGIYDLNQKKVHYGKKFSGIVEAVSYEGSRIAGIFASSDSQGENCLFGLHMNVRNGYHILLGGSLT